MIIYGAKICFSNVSFAYKNCKNILYTKNFYYLGKSKHPKRTLILSF